MDVELLVEAVGFCGPDRRATLLLREREGRRCLLLPVGQSEMYAIIQVLDKVEVRRPSTHDFLAEIVREAGLDGVSIRLLRWRGDVLRAAVTVARDDVPTEFDARPSDAIALALRLDMPVLASAGVMRRFAMKESDEPPELLALDDLPPDEFGEFIM